MRSLHLDDNIIQAYTWDKDILAPDQQLHMSTCMYCREKAESYRVLFAKVADLPAPAFDFDLSDIVMKQIQEQAAANTPGVKTASAKPNRVRIAWPILLVCLAGVALTGSVLYYLQDYFTDVLVGLSSLITILVIITVILIGGFLGYEEFRKYNKQMSRLDF
jgi:hypothetical protein